MRGAWVILLLAAAPAAADNRTARRATGAPAGAPTSTAPSGPHKEGEYGGVTPGDPQPRDPGKPARARRPPAKGTLTWIGFEAKDGGAEVFFQSVAPFTISQRVDGGQLLVQLALTRLGGNTWRQIDTRYFDNPLASIVARAVGAARATKDRPARAAGIEARIGFKNARDAHEATVRTATEADGRYYAYLTFPEGTAVSPVPARTSPPAPVVEPEAAPEAEPPAPAPARPAKPTAQQRDDDAPPPARSN